ncbi:hypothetical protein BASA82_000245 [Batrachochytrium salamandrivorans]|nr:hypothetical protein BASA81_002143 [Batrachochytrium salamandrivorans]KAH9262724.1 hypothetical protein BASA82_000245 [Batrachochytrium salamandrivorans]
MKLALPYALVGKRATPSAGANAVVLAEFAFDSNGPFLQLGRELLEDAEYNKMQIEGYTMLTLERDGLCFIVATEQPAEAQRVGREALQLISSSFAARIGTARAKAATRRHAFNVEFAPILQRHLEKFSRSREIDRELLDLGRDLEQAKTVAQTNIQHLVDRGSKLDSMSKTSEQLRDTGNRFQNTATKLRRMECWHVWQSRLSALCCAGVTVVILLVWFLK